MRDKIPVIISNLCKLLVGKVFTVTGIFYIPTFTVCPPIPMTYLYHRCMIGGRDVSGGNVMVMLPPHNLSHFLGFWHFMAKNWYY